MAFVSNRNGLEDIVELLVPELQRRGLTQTEYAVVGGTLRENLLGVPGQKHLRDDHYGATFAWERNQTAKETEKKDVSEANSENPTKEEVGESILDEKTKSAEIVVPVVNSVEVH